MRLKIILIFFLIIALGGFLGKQALSGEISNEDLYLLMFEDLKNESLGATGYWYYSGGYLKPNVSTWIIGSDTSNAYFNIATSTKYCFTDGTCQTSASAGGSQTPWTGNIAGAGYSLTGVNNFTATGTLTFAANAIEDADVVDTITASNYLLLSATTSFPNLTAAINLTDVGTIADLASTLFTTTNASTTALTVSGNVYFPANSILDEMIPNNITASNYLLLSATTTFPNLTTAANLTDIGTIADLAATLFTTTNASTTALTVSGTGYISTINSTATTTVRASDGFDYGNGTNGFKIHPGTSTTLEFY